MLSHVPRVTQLLSSSCRRDPQLENICQRERAISAFGSAQALGTIRVPLSSRPIRSPIHWIHYSHQVRHPHTSTFIFPKSSSSSSTPCFSSQLIRIHGRCRVSAFTADTPGRETRSPKGEEVQLQSENCDHRIQAPNSHIVRQELAMSEKESDLMGKTNACNHV